MRRIIIYIYVRMIKHGCARCVNQSAAGCLCVCECVSVCELGGGGASRMRTNDDPLHGGDGNGSGGGVDALLCITHVIGPINIVAHNTSADAYAGLPFQG